MLLTDIFRYIDFEKIYNFKKKNIKFNHVSTNTNDIKNSSIFILDAKKFKKEYFKKINQKKPLAILTNKYFKEILLPQIIVMDVYKNASIILNKLLAFKPLNSIGVTGTNGKTSVVWLVSQICTINNINIKTFGTLGSYIDGKNKSISNLTTPNFDVLHQFAYSKRKNNYNFIFEVSSHSLDQNRLKYFPVNIGILTNITHDHLDYHNTFNEYKQAKIKLFTNHLDIGGIAIINDKIEGIKYLRERLNLNNKILTYGKKDSDINLSIKNNKLEIKIFNKKYIKKNINYTSIELENLSCAISACLCLNIKINNILSCLRNLNGPPGRLDKVDKKNNNYQVYIDYAHTPDALKRVLLSKTENTLKPNLVFGCGGNRDKLKRSKMGMIANKFANKVYITDDNPRDENPINIRKNIFLKCKKAKEIPDRKEAITEAIYELKTSEVLIIAGKGHEKTQIYKNNIKKFDDKKIANFALKNKLKLNKLKNYLLKNHSKIKINSNDIIKGDVFIALPGKHFHGNRFINEAFANGAKFIITDIENKKTNKDMNVFVVEDTIKYLSSLANYKRTMFKGVVIGITGSIGKTSVKENLKFLLSKCSKVSASIKSYNNRLGVLLSLINLDLNSNFAIFEMGTNNFAEIKDLTSIVRPSQVIVTNIYTTHLENFINTRNIAIEKSDIFNSLYNSNVKVVILPSNNADEKFIFKLAQKQHVKNIINFGNDEGNKLRKIKIEKINNFCKMIFNYKNKIFTIILNNNQFYKINNILICFLIFEYNNLDLDLFMSLTKKIPLIEGRGFKKSIIINNKKINLIDESYNASPETMKRSIDYFKDINLENNKNKYLILGDMKELGKKSIFYHIELLKYVIRNKINKVIICGELMSLALDKLDYKLNDKLLFIKNLNMIIKFLNKELNNGDYILIKGSNSSLTNKLSQKLLKGVL
jgi:murE/murF fusion protein